MSDEREAIRKRFHDLYLGEYGFFSHEPYQEAMEEVDAYALAVHAQGCEKWQPGTHIDEARRGRHKCGDGWHCKIARQYLPKEEK